MVRRKARRGVLCRMSLASCVSPAPSVDLRLARRAPPTTQKRIRDAALRASSVHSARLVVVGSRSSQRWTCLLGGLLGGLLHSCRACDMRAPSSTNPLPRRKLFFSASRQQPARETRNARQVRSPEQRRWNVSVVHPRPSPHNAPFAPRSRPGLVQRARVPFPETAHSRSLETRAPGDGCRWPRGLASSA